MRTAWMLAAVVVVVSSSAYAQTGAQLLLDPLPERNTVATLEAALYNSGHVEGGQSLQLSTYEAVGRYKLTLDPLIKGIDRAQPRAGFDYYALVLDTDAALPTRFQDVSVGIGMGIAKTDKILAGITVGVGYASDSLFDDANAFYIKADLAVGYTISERQSVGVVIDFDGNRTFAPDIPLPGFQYRYKTLDAPEGGDPTLVLGVGFPISSVVYRPDDHWTFEFIYSIPDNLRGTIDYGFNENFGVFASLDSRNEAFHWDALDDSDDRLIFRQTRVELGLRGTVNKAFSFVVAGGYAFDQEFEVGFDSRDTDNYLDLSDEPYVRVGGEVRW